VPFGTFGGLNSIFHKKIAVFVFLDLDKFQNPKQIFFCSKHHRMGRKMICNQKIQNFHKFGANSGFGT
jgi:hypothetical protein